MIALQPGAVPHSSRVDGLGLASSAVGRQRSAYTRPLIAAFQRQRGLALGLATAGTSLTAMVMPPVIAAVIAALWLARGLYTMAASRRSSACRLRSC